MTMRVLVNRTKVRRVINLRQGGSVTLAPKGEIGERSRPIDEQHFTPEVEADRKARHIDIELAQ